MAQKVTCKVLRTFVNTPDEGVDHIKAHAPALDQIGFVWPDKVSFLMLELVHHKSWAEKSYGACVDMTKLPRNAGQEEGDAATQAVAAVKKSHDGDSDSDSATAVLNDLDANIVESETFVSTDPKLSAINSPYQKLIVKRSDLVVGTQLASLASSIDAVADQDKVRQAMQVGDIIVEIHLKRIYEWKAIATSNAERENLEAILGCCRVLAAGLFRRTSGGTPPAKGYRSPL